MPSFLEMISFQTIKSHTHTHYVQAPNPSALHHTQHLQKPAPFSGVENRSQHLYINIITQLEQRSQETEHAA